MYLILLFFFPNFSCFTISTKPLGQVVVTKPAPSPGFKFVNTDTDNGQASNKNRFIPHIKNFTNTHVCDDEDLCQRIRELRINSTFDFDCKAKNLLVDFQVQNQMTKQLQLTNGYLNEAGIIESKQQYEDCYTLRKYFINDDQSIVLFNSKIAIVDNKLIDEYIKSQLLNGTYYAVYALYNAGLFDIKKDDVLIKSSIWSAIALFVLMICMILIKKYSTEKYRIISEYLAAFFILLTDIVMRRRQNETQTEARNQNTNRSKERENISQNCIEVCSPIGISENSLVVRRRR